MNTTLAKITWKLYEVEVQLKKKIQERENLVALSFSMLFWLYLSAAVHLFSVQVQEKCRFIGLFERKGFKNITTKTTVQ